MQHQINPFHFSVHMHALLANFLVSGSSKTLAPALNLLNLFNQLISLFLLIKTITCNQNHFARNQFMYVASLVSHILHFHVYGSKEGKESLWEMEKREMQKLKYGINQFHLQYHCFLSL